jgi:hypothetical protein
MAAVGVLFIGIIGAIGFLLTGKKKKRDGKDEKGETEHEAESNEK